MRRIFLTDCAAGDIIEDVYVLSGKQFSAGSNGKYYIKVFVGDRSAVITARMWNATRDIFNAMPDNGFARIRGRIENYQNNLQCIIETLQVAREGTFDLADLLPQTKKNINQMCARLYELLGTIRSKPLAALIQAYLDDEKLMSDFCRAPAAMTFHHAFIGGLLEHTLNAMEVADALCPFYPGLNRDIVIAGIFLHDIAKTWELSYQTAFGYTDGGQLVGHIVKSAIWVEHKAKEAEKSLGGPIPQQLIDVMQHIIISHHGVPEFGAIKPPGTPEAIAVHYIENLDAKLMMSLSATRDLEAAPDDAAGPNWTEYMKAFSGRLYRPDVAPADEPAKPAPPSPAASRPSVAIPAEPRDKLVINNPLFESAPAKKK